VVSNVFVDGSDQFRHAGDHAAAQALIGDVAEEALDHVQPRRRCGREVHLEIDLLEELQPLGVAMALLALRR